MIPQNMESDNYNEQDIHLIFDCEQAMLRKKYAQPAIDDEWEKFRQGLASPATEAPVAPPHDKKKDP